ncbi:unnamed protein product, partial [Discosporangium mesarthrocarpum]
GSAAVIVGRSTVRDTGGILGPARDRYRKGVGTKPKGSTRPAGSSERDIDKTSIVSPSSQRPGPGVQFAPPAPPRTLGTRAGRVKA